MSVQILPGALMLRGIPVLINLSLKPTSPFADISYRDFSGQSQSAGDMNCENAKQGTSEEKETKSGCKR
jgi:hypothetical protein